MSNVTLNAAGNAGRVHPTLDYVCVVVNCLLRLFSFLAQNMPGSRSETITVTDLALEVQRLKQIINAQTFSQSHKDDQPLFDEPARYEDRPDRSLTAHMCNRVP